VLVNPRVAVPTGQVFAALGARAMTSERDDAAPPAPFAGASACLAYLAASRNDLEAPAIAIAPVIADVLARLQALPGCRLARMSGSGATCFGLFEDIEVARQAADGLREVAPDWWVAASRLR
jgi:4-diphosphocytidyl-2-C-methyl-D-erythritol kinase